MVKNNPKEKTEVLHDSDEIIRRAANAYRFLTRTLDVCADSIGPIIATAVEEIDVVFSTPNSFKRYEREGIIDLLAKKLDEGIKVRILINQTEDIRQSLERLVTIQPQRQIAIRELDKSIKTKLTTIMADRVIS